MRKSISKKKRDWAKKEGSKYATVMKNRGQHDARQSGEKISHPIFQDMVLFTQHIQVVSSMLRSWGKLFVLQSCTFFCLILISDIALC